LLTYTGVPVAEPPPPPELKPPPDPLDPPPQERRVKKEEISSIVGITVGFFIINFLQRLIPKSTTDFESLKMDTG